MHHFYQKSGKLFVEETVVEDLAKKYGTPLYIYSEKTLRHHYRTLDHALAPLERMICYAVKANSNLAVLSVLAQEGAGFDIVSGGELLRVLESGGRPDRCTYAGVGKTREEIELALNKGIYCFNVESEPELEFINTIAGKMKRKAPVAVRVNPNVAADTHHKITTGTYENKFGIAFEKIPALYAKIAKMRNLRILGVQMHIGSQILTPKPFAEAVKKMIPLVKKLKDRYDIEFFDIGGGIGIVYDPALESGQFTWWQKHKKPPLNARKYAEDLLPLLRPLGLKIIIEPGRFIVGNAGILITDVLYVKKTGKKNFVIVDAAMNDLVRPAMYDAYHEIVPLNTKTGTKIPSDIVGPICESGDVFCKDRMLPKLQTGDKLAIMSAGAYGFSMASNYNSRPRPAEILVGGKNAQVIRKRESFEDIIRNEAS